MPGWADILGLKKEIPEDEKGYKESLQRVRKIFENEVKLGIDTRRILIGGFSQGGAMSYLALEELGVPLAGLIVLSGWLPFAFSKPQRFKNMSKEVFNTPILHCHGIGNSHI
jgi:predicted esterase